MDVLLLLKKDIQKMADAKKAKHAQRFFKTGKGEYGEGDLFIGITVPQARLIAGKYKKLHLFDVKKLLESKIHEERLIALFILVSKFQKGTEEERKNIYEFYFEHTKFVNNWDLVDSSAGYIIGNYLQDKNKNILIQLAKSKNIWERRISIIATYSFIKNKKESEWTFKIADILLNDKEDLIHKAVGWMLREVGKIDQEIEEDFLNKHYKTMPRTMLRYAIERFPQPLRIKYLSKS